MTKHLLSAVTTFINNFSQPKVVISIWMCGCPMNVTVSQLVNLQKLETAIGLSSIFPGRVVSTFSGLFCKDKCL